MLSHHQLLLCLLPQTGGISDTFSFLPRGYLTQDVVIFSPLQKGQGWARGDGPAWGLVLPSRHWLHSSPHPQAWWPLATLTRRDGRLDSSPWSVVRLLWLTDKCSWARTKEQGLSGVAEVSMESPLATMILHHSGSLGHPVPLSSPLPHTPASPSAHACPCCSVISSGLLCPPAPAPTVPACPLTAPYQLLQGSQLLRQVTEAGAVQLQPPETGHGPDVLREVASLGGTGGEAGLGEDVPALPPATAPTCPWRPLGATEPTPGCVAWTRHPPPAPQFLTRTGALGGTTQHQDGCWLRPPLAGASGCNWLVPGDTSSTQLCAQLGSNAFTQHSRLGLHLRCGGAPWASASVLPVPSPCQRPTSHLWQDPNPRRKTPATPTQALPHPHSFPKLECPP